MSDEIVLNEGEMTLPSGAVLFLRPAPFADALKLFQAILGEFRAVSFTESTDHMDLLKNLFCMGFASPGIMEALEVCLKRCAMSFERGSAQHKIAPQLFEDVKRRGDYLTVCLEVAKVNVAPFVKSLFAGLKDISPIVESFRP